jgi:hypothetical protein
MAQLHVFEPKIPYLAQHRAPVLVPMGIPTGREGEHEGGRLNWLNELNGGKAFVADLTGLTHLTYLTI